MKEILRAVMHEDGQLEVVVSPFSDDAVLTSRYAKQVSEMSRDFANSIAELTLEALGEAIGDESLVDDLRCFEFDEQTKH